MQANSEEESLMENQRDPYTYDEQATAPYSMNQMYETNLANGASYDYESTIHTVECPFGTSVEGPSSFDDSVLLNLSYSHPFANTNLKIVENTDFDGSWYFPSSPNIYRGAGNLNSQPFHNGAMDFEMTGQLVRPTDEVPIHSDDTLRVSSDKEYNTVWTTETHLKA
jgi:hypothetical protein